MSEQRAPGLRFLVAVVILALSAAALLAGCKQKPEGAAGVPPGGPGGQQQQAEGEETAAATTKIPEVDEAEKVRDFAALYGPVTRLDEKDWDGRLLEWVVFTYDGSSRKLKGRSYKLPLSMVVDAPCAEILEGYFPIYAATARPTGKTISTQIVTAPRRPEHSPEEVKEIIRKATPAAAAAAGGVAASAATGAAGAAAGGARGGMGRGGRGEREMRGRGGDW